jgi:DDE superfamily endonuclease
LRDRRDPRRCLLGLPYWLFGAEQRGRHSTGGSGWWRPKLTARGDPDHDHVVAGIVARLIDLPRWVVVLAGDETHLNLLPHVRASWTLRGMRPEVLTPGTNRKVTVFGAIEVTTGAWVYRLGRRCAADFIAFPGMLAEAFPQAPVIVAICDNDSIHHARKVIPTWRSIPAWSCSTAPGTARMTTRPNGSGGHRRTMWPTPP